MPDEPLDQSALRMLRGVMNEAVGGIRQVPTGRTTTAEKKDAGTLELRIRTINPSDPVAHAIAAQVFGHTEFVPVRSIIPDEIAFRGALAL